MSRVVVDASAMAAVVFYETEGPSIRDRLAGARLFAPRLLQYEMANIAWKKVRRAPTEAAAVFGSLAVAFEKDWDIAWHDAPATDVALVAHATGLSAYDATYVWLAGSLGADLVTLDDRIAAATALINA